MKKAFVLVFMVCAAALFIACQNNAGNPGGSSGGGGGDKGVPFDNFTTRSVSVKNNTGERLIAFKGEISSSALISGVPAHASNHGLKLDASLFSGTGDFALLFLKESDYLANINNLSVIKNEPFASVYAFYNKSGTNDLVYTISSKSGGSARFTLQNNSAFNVEIRNNSPEGEVLGYVGAYTANTILNLDPGDYTLYPIFKKYFARDNEIYSVVPKFTTSKKPYSRDFAVTTAASWNVGTLWDPAQLKLSSGGFYLTINNQARTAVRFSLGDSEFETSLGIKGISSGSQATFFIPFAKSADGSYPDSFEMSTLTIGSALYPHALPKYTYNLDTKYEITVTGAEADNLSFGTGVADKGAVDIDGLFGL